MHPFKLVLEPGGMLRADSAADTLVAKEPALRSSRIDRISLVAAVIGTAPSLFFLRSDVVESLLNRSQGSFSVFVQLVGLAAAFLSAGAPEIFLISGKGRREIQLTNLEEVQSLRGLSGSSGSLFIAIV